MLFYEHEMIISLCKCKLQNALRSLGDQKAHSFESPPQLTAETSSHLDIL